MKSTLDEMGSEKRSERTDEEVGESSKVSRVGVPKSPRGGGKLGTVTAIHQLSMRL